MTCEHTRPSGCHTCGTGSRTGNNDPRCDLLCLVNIIGVTMPGETWLLIRLRVEVTAYSLWLLTRSFSCQTQPKRNAMQWMWKNCLREIKAKVRESHCCEAWGGNDESERVKTRASTCSFESFLLTFKGHEIASFVVPCSCFDLELEQWEKKWKSKYAVNL